MSTKSRRTDILREAFRILQENGLPMLSYDLIAKKSGLSRQLIRYYFSNKEDMMIALCDMMAVTYRESLVNVVLTANSTDRLEQFLDFYFNMLDGVKKPRDDQVYDAMMSLAAGSELVRDNLRGQYCLLGNVVSHELTVKYPKLSVDDANQISYLFVCLMYGHWKMVATLGLSEIHNGVTRKAVDRLIDSYLRKPVDDEDRPAIWTAH